MMVEKKHESAPGDGIRSLRSTTLFRAINYELYVRPNKGIMFFGAVTMLSCIGYLIYMRQISDGSKYYSEVAIDGTIDLKKKKSKWAE